MARDSSCTGTYRRRLSTLRQPHTLQHLPLLQLGNVSYATGAAPVLSGITCDVEVGECLGVQGPNGAGKTTLLRLMATLLRPTTGHGQVFGARLGTDEVGAIRSRIGLSGHLPALTGPLTLSENLNFAASVIGRPTGVVGDALEMVGLSGAADRPAEKCSHGMRKRADLARLLVTQPSLVLLDEPHEGLDSTAWPIVTHLLRQTLDKGGAAVVVSHDPSTLAELANRQLTIRDGVLT